MEPPAIPPSIRSRRVTRIAWIVLGCVLAYLVGAYLILPALWIRAAHRHPALDNLPGITTTGADIPGDPLNVALVGTEAELIGAMLTARWHPADPLSLASSLKIAAATILRRPYEDAPVSNLFLWGRKEDLAFEKPVGTDPRQRHHVRFWRSHELDEAGRPLWAGSITYDRSVGLSHTTGQITHHIGPDIDAERDLLFRELESARLLSKTTIVDGFHKTPSGRNGGGDPWKTDGRLFVGWIAPVTPPSPQ